MGISPIVGTAPRAGRHGNGAVPQAWRKRRATARRSGPAVGGVCREVAAVGADFDAAIDVGSEKPRAGFLEPSDRRRGWMAVRVAPASTHHRDPWPQTG